MADAELAARAPLTRERVLRAAIVLTDESGIEALTMRRLAEALGAEAMSLYYHVSGKDGVLDGMAEMVAQEISEAAAQIRDQGSWKATARARILAAGEVLLRHQWAPGVLASRAQPVPAVR